MSLFSWHALKRATLTFSVLSLFTTVPLLAKAQTPPAWYLTVGTGESLSAGTFISNGHHYTIQYIGIDDDVGRTNPSTFYRPQVITQTNTSSGQWTGSINGNYTK